MKKADKREKTFAEQVDDVLAGRADRYNDLKVCDTPQILLDVGCEQLPIFYTKKHLRDAIKPKSYTGEGIHYHGLDVMQIKRVPELLRKPVAVYDSLSRRDTIVLVTSELDTDNLPVIAAIRPSGCAKYNMNTVESNFMLSFHGRQNIEWQLLHAISQDKILFISKQKSQELFSVLGLQLSKGLNNLDFDTILHQSRNIVNHFAGDGNDIVNSQRETHVGYTDTYKPPSSQEAVVSAFRTRTKELFHELDGENAESIEMMVRSHVEEAIADFNIDAHIVDVVLVGSRCRGVEREDSDVDVVIEFYGSEREDSLCDFLNEEGLAVAGNRIDINPIKKDKTGTLETYLPAAEEYLREKASGMVEKDLAGEMAKEQELVMKRERERVDEEQKCEMSARRYANFYVQRRSIGTEYLLFADVMHADGRIDRDKPIAQFTNKTEAVSFCKSQGIHYDDMTNSITNVINHKKQIANLGSVPHPLDEPDLELGITAKNNKENW